MIFDYLLAKVSNKLSRDPEWMTLTLLKSSDGQYAIFKQTHKKSIYGNDLNVPSVRTYESYKHLCVQLVDEGLKDIEKEMLVKASARDADIKHLFVDVYLAAMSLCEKEEGVEEVW